MEISMTALAWELLYSVILGGFLGIAYDVARILRVATGVYSFGAETSLKIPSFVKKYINLPKKKSRKGRGAAILVALGDVAFFCFSACAISVFVYYFNDGILRGFVIFGVVVGFALYYCTVGRIVLFFAGRAISFIKTSLICILFLLFFPICFVFLKIYSIFYALICKITLIIIKVYAIIYLNIYSYYITKRLVRVSDEAFL